MKLRKCKFTTVWLQWKSGIRLKLYNICVYCHTCISGILVFCVTFCGWLFDHCIVCSSSIYQLLNIPLVSSKFSGSNWFWAKTESYTLVVTNGHCLNKLLLIRSLFEVYFIKLNRGSSWSWSYGTNVVEFTTTSAYHHYSCEFESRSWRGILDTKLCDKVCQWLAKGRWFSPGTTISTTNKTDRHDITEIVLKVTLNTIKKFDSRNTTVWNTNKNVDIKFSAHECTTSFWNNFIRYAQNRKIVKPNKIIKHIYMRHLV
jgi:hypothetical protein